MVIERHYRTRELCDLLAVSDDTITRLVQRGELDAVYVGSERRFSESAVKLYLQRHKVPARSVPAAGGRRDSQSPPMRDRRG